MATQPTEPGAPLNPAAAAALAADEAERLASQFRPSWDTDDAAPAAHDPAASTLVSQAMSAPPEHVPAAQIIAAPPAPVAAPARRAIGGSRTMLGIAPPPEPVAVVPDLVDAPAPHSSNGEAAMAAAAGPVLPPKAQQIAIPDEPSIVVSEPRIPTPAPPRRAAPEARPMIAPRPVEVTEDDDYVPRPQGGSKKGIVIGAVAFAALIVVVAGVKVAMKGGDSGAPANAPTVAATTPAAPPDTTTAAAPTPPEPTPPPDEKPADPKPSDKPKKVAAADPVAPPPPAALPPQPPAARDPKPAGKTDSGKKSPKAGGGSIVRDVPF